MKIDWEKVWIRYNEWVTSPPYPDPVQKLRKIQSLVEQQLRQKVKRRKK